MAASIIECVPNFSEGRDPRIVEAIVDAIASVPGSRSWPMNPTLTTTVPWSRLRGAPGAVVQAAFRGIAKAVELIRLPAHTGVHPRIGAADVVPLVPIAGITLAECAALAHELGEEVWRKLGLPVYFYEAAARTEDRRRLENIRRGGIEWLSAHVSERPPDIGGPMLHPTAGAAIIGARKFLVAFNVNLNTCAMWPWRERSRAGSGSRRGD